MYGHRITTVYIVARVCAATWQAITTWRAGIALIGLDSEVVGADEALLLLKRNDVSFLIDGADDYDLQKKMRLAHIIHGAGDFHAREIVVFLLSHSDARQTLGLTDNSFFWFHEPEEPMDVYYEHLAGHNLVEIPKHCLLA